MDDFTTPDGRVAGVNLNNFESAHRDFGIHCECSICIGISFLGIIRVYLLYITLHFRLKGCWLIVKGLVWALRCSHENSVELQAILRMHRLYRISYESRRTFYHRIEPKIYREQANYAARVISVVSIMACHWIETWRISQKPTTTQWLI